MAARRSGSSPTALHLGPQSNLAGEVARLFAELTGHGARRLLRTPGTEAVMTALRLARAETGRRKVAHVRRLVSRALRRRARACAPDSANGAAVPAALGISPAIAEDLLVLDYGRAESLEVIRAQRPTSSRRSSSSRCRAAVPICSRASSCASCARSRARSAPR